MFSQYCNNKKEIELVFSSKQDWPHARKVSRWLQLLSFIAQAVFQWKKNMIILNNQDKLSSVPQVHRILKNFDKFCLIK